MSTTVAQWGNSHALRIPSKILKRSRFASGDSVDFDVTPEGNILVVPAEKEHRRVSAPRKLTAKALYAANPVDDVPAASNPWPNDDMVGAEWDAWSS